MIDYLIHITIIASIYAIIALALDLIVGYTGLLSISQAAFFGVGAYSTAILTVSYGINFFLSMLIGILIVIILSALIGGVVGRFKGDYFALVTLGFSVIIYSILLNWQNVTNGPLGIAGIPRPKLFSFTFSDNGYFLLLTLTFLIGIYFITKFIGNSSFGRALKAIREDEEALSIFGYRTSFFKFTIFIIGSSVAAIAGSFYASYISFIDPSSFALNESIFILTLIILGGLQSQKGAIFGAFLLVILPEALRFVGFSSDIAAQMRELLYGLALILFMMYRSQGIFGEYKL